jgi:hypothetical protein
MHAIHDYDTHHRVADREVTRSVRRACRSDQFAIGILSRTFRRSLEVEAARTRSAIVSQQRVQYDIIRTSQDLAGIKAVHRSVQDAQG